MSAKPMCGRCGHPVDQLLEERQDHCDRIVFTVRCHGESERIVLDSSTLRALKSLSFGTAFVQPKQLQAVVDAAIARRPV